MTDEYPIYYGMDFGLGDPQVAVALRLNGEHLVLLGDVGLHLSNLMRAMGRGLSSARRSSRGRGRRSPQARAHRRAVARRWR